jgi:predicted SAM-dependent methyltransferase
MEPDGMFGMEFTHSRIAISRPVWSYSKVQQFVAALIRGRTAFMNLKEEGLVLDVGCGPNINVDSLNLDYSWRPGIDICCDITKGLPLPDEYVGGIFTERCIEHIPFEAALFVFREFYRVMKPNAYVRIVVPDLEIYLEHYFLSRKTGEVSMPYASGDARSEIYSPAMSVNRIFRDHGHQFISNFPTMATLLKRVGFVDIQKTRFGCGAVESLILDSEGRAIESLYVEGKKPA